MEIHLSDNFKRKTFAAIFSIIVFIVVYLLLLILAIALTVLCAYGGIMLIVSIPKFVTILLGIGLASFGIIILFFLFKFLFNEHSIDRSHLEEITYDNHPRLFDMIGEIANEVETKFPKKVYMSSDVNAAVFYDSSFWSMFFPIRKNLQIGMGLVNTVTEQELKAILAHEFGHFSQRSMSVGSYVYNVNQVIYNMLYDNESFDKTISGWAGITGYFSIFVIIAVKVIQGIQWVLQKLYGYVNLKYMALSREMEFHADEIAANIAGSQPLQESLMRLNLSVQAYNLALSFYEKKKGENLISQNIYKDQLFTLDILVKENKIPLKNNLPHVSLEDLNKYNKSRLNIEDQWSSHPSTEERVDALARLNITKNASRENPATDLFTNVESLEEKLTVKEFYYSTFHKGVRALNAGEFREEFVKEYAGVKFPSGYNGYYDNKNPIPFDVENIMDYTQITTMDTLFGDDKVEMVYNYIAMKEDRDTLENIYNKKVPVKKFEYSGQRYNRKDSGRLVAELDKEIKIISTEIEKNDIAIYKFFYGLAQKKGNENILKSKYISFFQEDKDYENRYNLFLGFAEIANDLSRVTSDDQVEDIFKRLYQLEINLKSELKAFLESPFLKKDITEAAKDELNNYLSRNWSYSKNSESDQEYLEALFRAVNHFYDFTANSYFYIKLDLLNYQIEQYRE